MLKRTAIIGLACMLGTTAVLAQTAPKTVEQNLIEVLRAQVHGMLDANANLQAQYVTMQTTLESVRKEFDALKAKNAAPAAPPPPKQP